MNIYRYIYDRAGGSRPDALVLLPGGGRDREPPRGGGPAAARGVGDRQDPPAGSPTYAIIVLI